MEKKTPLKCHLFDWIDGKGMLNVSSLHRVVSELH